MFFPRESAQRWYLVVGRYASTEELNAPNYRGAGVSGERRVIRVERLNLFDLASLIHSVRDDDEATVDVVVVRNRALVKDPVRPGFPDPPILGKGFDDSVERYGLIDAVGLVEDASGSFGQVFSHELGHVIRGPGHVMLGTHLMGGGASATSYDDTISGPRRFDEQLILLMRRAGTSGIAPVLFPAPGLRSMVSIPASASSFDTDSR